VTQALAPIARDTDERFTPESVLAVVREFHCIVLDPCTAANNPVGAGVWLTECGLGANWGDLIANAFEDGIAFWNPPYSRGQLLQWVTKAHAEWRLEGVESIGLIPSDTSTRATQYVLETANAIAFWKKRICFAGEQGAKFANALPYYGERQGRFKRVFEDHAIVLVLR